MHQYFHALFLVLIPSLALVDTVLGTIPLGKMSLISQT